MSYTTINGMRSNRYPFMGVGNSGDGLSDCGCGCGGSGGCGSSEASAGETIATGLLGGLATVGVAGAVIMGTLWFMTKDIR